MNECRHVLCFIRALRPRKILAVLLPHVFPFGHWSPTATFRSHGSQIGTKHNPAACDWWLFMFIALLCCGCVVTGLACFCFAVGVSHIAPSGGTGITRCFGHLSRLT